MEKRYDLTLDITHRTKNTNYILCSGDTVNSFDITLNDSGNAIDLTDLHAVAFFEIPDGTYVENNCTIADGIITVTLGTTETAQDGVVSAQIKLYNTAETQVLTSNLFTFKVNPNYDDDTTVSEVATNVRPNISQGTTAPSEIPTKIGDIYINTTAKKAYLAMGTSSSADWVLIN